MRTLKEEEVLLDGFFPISIANLGNGTTKADLLTVMSQFGHVRNCFIPSPISPFNLTALDVFSNSTSSARATEEFNGAYADKRKLVVRNLNPQEIKALDLLRRIT